MKRGQEEGDAGKEGGRELAHGSKRAMPTERERGSTAGSRQGAVGQVKVWRAVYMCLCECMHACGCVFFVCSMQR